MPSNTSKEKADEGLKEVLAAVDSMPDDDRAIGQRLHEIISSNAPDLVPRTWYGMPAYADSNGKVLCFFRSKKKFGERFMTLGFNDVAKLDDGNLWPISYAITKLTDDEEAIIAELVRKAVS